MITLFWFHVFISPLAPPSTNPTPTKCYGLYLLNASGSFYLLGQASSSLTLATASSSLTLATCLPIFTLQPQGTFQNVKLITPPTA